MKCDHGVNAEDRLTAWRPTMREYHADASISSGFLSRVISEGLSVALAERTNAGVTTGRRMGRGTALHSWFTGDETARIEVAPTEVKARRGKLWDATVAAAKAYGADAVITVADRNDCLLSWMSLFCHDAGMPELDTPAKSKIRAMLRQWSPRYAEVSHRWEPFPGCWCRIREDSIARASGLWGAFQLKTTEAPLPTWGRYWHRYVRHSSAFYRAGLRDLFGAEPFEQFVVVARLVPPFPWAIFDLAQRAEELDALWAGEIRAHLEQITESLARSERFGPEEKGACL